MLARVGGVTDLVVLQAAVLHDTLEDTETTQEELVERFGEPVARVVAEVTDDKELPKEERKRLQIEHAPELSPAARLVKLGDKICNVSDVMTAPPKKWSAERRAEYVEWARRVVDGCRGTNAALERHFDALAAEARTAIGGLDEAPEPQEPKPLRPTARLQARGWPDFIKALIPVGSRSV